MRRCAVSVPPDIVGGCARESQSEYFYFIEIALGSLRELHYRFSLARRLAYLDESDYQSGESKIVETEKALSALLRSMRKED